jgi:signal peptidase
VGPSFAYRFALLGFEWFSPLLPDLGWSVLFLVGVTVPLAAAWLVRSIYQDTREGAQRMPAPVEEDKPAARPKARWRGWVGWGVTGVLVALIVLVMTGTLGIRLVVVDGISMEPAYKRGDVAIVHEGVDPASLQVKDVIQYRQGGFSVVHRIVTIEEGPEGRVFTTQGDNNDAPDDPISAADIVGKVVFLIPEVGHLNLWVTGR